MQKGCYNCKHDTPTGHPCETCLSTHGKDLQPTNWEAAENYEPSTNADRIRAMTDEELARFLVDISADCTSRCECCAYTRRCTDKCIGGVRDWLRQPVKED